MVRLYRGRLYLYRKDRLESLKRQKWKPIMGNHRAKIINRAACDFDKLHR